jgi:glycolate oxidase iron-sulfur subunit
LKKSLGVAAQPRALVGANQRYELQEMAEADWCCGMGGSFNLQHYEISARIGRRKRDNIVQSGCEVVATGCPACMLQITDMLSRPGTGQAGETRYKYGKLENRYFGWPSRTEPGKSGFWP